jgi:hypothetical protein
MQLPGDIKLNYFDKENNMQEISVEELTKGKKVRITSSSPILTKKRTSRCLPVLPSQDRESKLVSGIAEGEMQLIIRQEFR